MSITAWPGPILSYGQTLTSTGNGITGGNMENNPQRGPSIFDLGNAIGDPRAAYAYKPGSDATTDVFGLWHSQGLVDAVPSVQGSSYTNPYTPGTIVSCLTGSSVGTTALTLNTTVSSANGVTLNVSVFAPELGTNVTMTMAVDYASPSLSFGSDGAVQMWNPANAIARAIVITGSSSGADDSGVTALVAGRDIYGFPMSETITLGTSSLNGAIGRKAFKYVKTITLANSTTLVSSHINIAFADKFGFPTLVNRAGYHTIQTISSNSSTSTTYGASQGVVYASTAAATATTSDVRGTWLSTAASVSFDGNTRLYVRTQFDPVNLATVTSTTVYGLFGVTQYST